MAAITTGHVQEFQIRCGAKTSRRQCEQHGKAKSMGRGGEFQIRCNAKTSRRQCEQHDEAKSTKLQRI